MEAHIEFTPLLKIGAYANSKSNQDTNNNTYFSMKKSSFSSTSIWCLTLYLLVISSLADYQVKSTPETVTVLYPPESEVIYQNSYIKNNPNPTAPGAFWIWHNKNSTKGAFQALFYATCPNVGLSITIIANSSFYAYFNGISFKAYNVFQSVSTDVYNIKCGLNNLTIIVENLEPNATSAAVAFNVYQNSGWCPQCKDNGYYNINTCTCQCSALISCPSAYQRQFGYPLCGCKCINQPYTYCNYNAQYFEQSSCSCKCYPRFCRQGLQQDQKSCECRCKSQTCSQGKSWSYKYCACV